MMIAAPPRRLCRRLITLKAGHELYAVAAASVSFTLRILLIALAEGRRRADVAAVCRQVTHDAAPGRSFSG